MFDINVENIKNQDLTRNNMKDFKASVDKVNPNAFYEALVTNTNDIYKLGRVQIRIPSIHGVDSSQAYYLADSSLPWARPAILSSAANDMGQYVVPCKGARVIVSFECDDINKPIYFGGIPNLINNTKTINDNNNIFFGQELNIDSDDRILDLDENSAQYVLFKSLKGSTIIFNDKDGKESIKLIDAAGQQIIMENSSEYTLPRRGNKTNPPDTASISVITNGNLNLKSNNLNIEANTITGLPNNQLDLLFDAGTTDKSITEVDLKIFLNDYDYLDVFTYDSYTTSVVKTTALLKYTNGTNYLDGQYNISHRSWILPMTINGVSLMLVKTSTSDMITLVNSTCVVIDTTNNKVYDGNHSWTVKIYKIYGHKRS